MYYRKVYSESHNKKKRNLLDVKIEKESEKKNV